MTTMASPLRDEQALIRTLLGGLLVALIARATIFREGGPGAVICLVVFDLCALGLVGVAIKKVAVQRQGGRGAVLKWMIVALTLLAFVYEGLVTGGPTDGMGAAVVLVGLVVLGAVIVTERMRSREKQPPTSVTTGPDH